MKKKLFYLLLGTTLFGNLKLMAQDWKNGGNLLTTDGSFGTTSPHSVTFKTNTVEHGILTSAGLWGFGTTTPDGKVAISYNSVAGNPQLSLYESANDYVRINFRNTASTNWFGIAAKPAANAANAKLNFWYQGTGNVMTVQGDGNVGVGVVAPVYKLDVCGTIRSKEIIVQTGWCDYVFDSSYKLRPLDEVANFVSQNKHLPNIPPASEVETNGLKMGDMSTKMMEKIEEITLYLFDMNTRLKALEKENETLKNKMANKSK